jgi:hypothetical protein
MKSSNEEGNGAQHIDHGLGGATNPRPPRTSSMDTNTARIRDSTPESAQIQRVYSESRSPAPATHRERSELAITGFRISRRVVVPYTAAPDQAHHHDHIDTVAVRKGRDGLVVWVVHRTATRVKSTTPMTAHGRAALDDQGSSR